MVGVETKEVEVLSPFEHLANYNKYPDFLKIIVDAPDLLKNIESVTGSLLDSAVPEEIYNKHRDEISEWTSIFLGKTKSPSDFISDAKAVRGRSALFHHFCKEVSGSLKFNILSRGKSGGKIRRELSYVLDEYSELIEPGATFRMFTGTATEYGILMNEDRVNLTGQSLHVFFNTCCSTSDEKCDKQKSEQLFLYVVTIGCRLDREVKRLSDPKGDIYKAYLLNGLGAGATDVVAYDLVKYLEKRYLKNNVRKRFHRVSPGYRDWSLSDQKIIFKVLNPESSINVTLMSSYLMKPLKSTSGLVGPVLKSIKIGEVEH